MPNVLIVDDSDVDRRLVGGLLCKLPDLEVNYATNGRDAPEQIAQHPFDLVLTDLMMPVMNGLELVAALVAQYPLVPVILMTRRGSEQIAVQALQTGAASYVPKRHAGHILVDTVHHVLEAATRQRCAKQLMDCLEYSELAFMLRADPCVIPPLVNHLHQAMRLLGICEQSDEIRVCVALEEAINNALFHGNLEIDSDLRTCDSQAYRQLVEDRCQCTPYCDRHVRVEARLTAPDARFVVRDEGAGFNPAGLPDPTDPENLEKACGRGLSRMRTFMDVVEFNEHGNEVTMIKRATKARLPDRPRARLPKP